MSEQVEAATQDLDLSAQLPTIHVPTLILSGRFDVNVAPLTAWRMYKTIPGARLYIFEHSGHLPSYEEPEAYFQQLSIFLLKSDEEMTLLQSNSLQREGTRR